MTARILLIRHGQSANNALPEELRVCDPGLTQIGQRQAERLAQSLANAKLDSLLCSPFLRSLETVKPVAIRRNQTVAIRSDIFEKGGCYSGYNAIGKKGEAGMGASELATKYPGWSIDERIAEAGWWGHDVESNEAVLQRAQTVARWVEDTFVPTSGTHALVIHADFKSILLKALMQKSDPLYQVSELLWNAGVTELRWNEGTECWNMERLNNISHLPRELHTY